MGTNSIDDAIKELRHSPKFLAWGKPRLSGLEQSNIMKDERHYSVSEVASLGESAPTW